MIPSATPSRRFQVVLGLGFFCALFALAEASAPAAAAQGGGAGGAGGAGTGGLPAPAAPALARWEYYVASCAEAELGSELNRLGALGWELFSAENRGREYFLILKRPLRPVILTAQEKAMVGVWELVKGEKGPLAGVTLECTSSKTVKIRAETRAASGKTGSTMIIYGTYEILEGRLIVNLGVGNVKETSRDKITRLTASELVIEDEQGRIEEYRKK